MVLFLVLLNYPMYTFDMLQHMHTFICIWSNKTDVHVITKTFISRVKVRACCLTLPYHSVWNLALLGTSLMVLKICFRTYT